MHRRQGFFHLAAAAGRRIIEWSSNGGQNRHDPQVAQGSPRTQRPARDEFRLRPSDALGKKSRRNIRQGTDQFAFSLQAGQGMIA